MIRLLLLRRLESRGKDMSLLKCPECGKEVSDKAGVCPNCGFPIEKKDEKEVNEMADNSEEITDKEKKLLKKD